MDELIRIQRATVDEHIRAENARKWPAVYDTFVQDEDSAFYDVVPLHSHFAGMTVLRISIGQRRRRFPDFRIDVWGEFDTPGAPYAR